MIVPMTRYSILVFHRDFPQFMRKLQEKGLLDIRQNEIYSPKSDEEYYPILERVEKVLQALKAEKKMSDREKGNAVSDTVPDFSRMDASGLLQEAERLLTRKKACMQELEEVGNKLREVSVWGDFDAERLQELRKKAGIGILLASASAKKFPETDVQAETGFPVWVISKEASTVYFAYVYEGEAPSPEQMAKELGFSVSLYPFPQKTCSVWISRKKEREEELFRVQAGIRAVLNEKKRLEDYKTGLFDKLAYKTVSLNVPEEAEGSLRFVEGFLPSEQKAVFEAFLDGEEVVYRSCAAEELSQEETPRIPVLLRNNRFARLFEPITLLFSLPNYREIDLTPMLAPFFMAFFGFCLGDAGYGLLLVAAGLYLAKKLSASYRGYGWLTFWFGIATVLFGTLSGTFFGISLMQVEFLGKMRDYIFDSDKMMTLALVIGGVQILFGMVMNVLRITKEEGFRFALYKAGWLAVIVGGGILVGLPMLGILIPAFLAYVLYAVVGLGALFALFYNQPGKNPLFNLGSGLWDTYNMATGLVGDLLSYIRLFALGLTGGILGSVFNTLALDAATGIGVPVVSQLVMLVILLFGHGLNLALCILGALVHPLRLTFVEFYKNAGFEGGGKAYRPFALSKKD